MSLKLSTLIVLMTIKFYSAFKIHLINVILMGVCAVVMVFTQKC